MAANVSSLSPAQLKQLKAGQNIAIRYARSQEEVDNGASRIMYEQFPKNVAVAFSVTWAAMFPAMNRMSLADMSQPQRTSVTIVSSQFEVAHRILTWILSCCEGKGMQQYPMHDSKAFYKYFVVKQTADNMGIAVLSREMNRRLQAIASRQIHSEDVRAMYLNLPADHPILKDIAVHIADLIWERKLKAFGAYRTLREEVPRFDKDVNDILEPRRAEYKEERRKQEQDRQAAARKVREAQVKQSASDDQKRNGIKHTKRRSIDHVARQYLYHDHKRSSSSGSANTKTMEAQGDANESPIQHKTLRCTIARKSQGGRPTYVALSLGDMGISKDEFTGDAFLQPPTRKQRTHSKTRSAAAATLPYKGTNGDHASADITPALSVTSTTSVTPTSPGSVSDHPASNYTVSTTPTHVPDKINDTFAASAMHMSANTRH